MHIGIMTMTFSLPGCGSLKEKRQRMGGMHERFGRTPSVATSRREVESQCSQIEDKIQRTVEGRVIKVTRELL